jgi:hypothetical protein
VAGKNIKTAAMGQQIADSEFACDIRIIHPELRQMVDDLVVPAQLAFVYEDGERGSSKCLRVGTDLEQCVWVDAAWLPGFAYAVALGEDELAVCNNSDRHAGDLKGLHRTSYGLVYFLGCNDRRRGTRIANGREQQCESCCDVWKGEFHPDPLILGTQADEVKTESDPENGQPAGHQKDARHSGEHCRSAPPGQREIPGGGQR